MKKLTTTIILCILSACMCGQPVDITVPIYTINVKGISIPFEFKYHASGIRYDDLPVYLTSQQVQPSMAWIQSTGMDKKADENGIKKGVLTKIVYPTGGYGIFEYEARRADSKMYGGLRIVG